MKELVRAAAHVRYHQGAVMVLKIGGACLRKPRFQRALDLREKGMVYVKGLLEQ